MESIMRAKLLAFSLITLLIALGLQLPALADENVKDHTVLLEGTWELDVPCLGETVQISYFWNFNSTVRTDKDGISHLKLHINDQGSTAVGMETGTSFHVTGSKTEQWFEYTTQDNLILVEENLTEVMNLVSSGKGNDAKYQARFQYSGVFNISTGTWVWLVIKHYSAGYDCK